MMSQSLKDQILASEDIPHEDVPVPEWGGVTVRVKGLSGTDRDAYEAKSVAMKNQGQDVELRLADFRSKLLVKCLFDPETDQRVFKDSEAKDLGRKNGRVIDRLFDKARSLSGMTKESKDQGKDNSETGQSGDSTSA